MHKITYRDLEEVLLGYGFTKKVDNGHILYIEKVNDAIIALPNLPLDEPVRPHHYVTARKTLDGRGVTEEQDFEKAMKERGELPAGITTVI
jgi:hypothetical protein